MALSKCHIEGWISGAPEATNRTTPTPETREQSEKWAKVASEISYHTQRLCQVSAKSVDHQFLPLGDFLRQGHLIVELLLLAFLADLASISACHSLRTVLFPVSGSGQGTSIYHP